LIKAKLFYITMVG